MRWQVVWVLLLSLMGTVSGQPLTEVSGWRPGERVKLSKVTEGLLVELAPVYSMVEYPLEVTDLRRWRLELSWRWRSEGSGEARATLRCGRKGETVRLEPGDWRSQKVVMDIPGQATDLKFFVHGQNCKVWLDDFQLKKVAELLPARVEAARALSERELINLTAFGKLFGDVRYFYPSRMEDWDAFCVDGVRAVAGCADDRELSQTLTGLFRPVAPGLKINGVAAREIPAASAEWRAWHHRGLSLVEHPVYRSELRVSREPKGWFHFKLAGDIAVDLPLAAPADWPDAKFPGRLQEFVLGDRATRLAAILEAWSVFDHFYPYFDSVGLDWSRSLGPALRSAAEDPDEVSFGHTFLRMLADLQDGHSRLMGPGGSVLSSLPFGWSWVGEQLVISQVGGSQLPLGAVIVQVNGRPVSEVMAEARPLISGSPQYVRLQATARILSGNPRLTLDTGAEVTVGPGSDELTAEKRPEAIAQIRPGVVYCDITRVDEAAFQAALPELVKARGIVIDCRGYPKFHTFLQHCSRTSMQSAQWLVPDEVQPDRSWKWDRSGRWQLEPVEPYLGGKVVFLTDANAISFAESCMGVVEAYKLGPIVGAPTAGCNGNMNSAAVVGGYSFTFTGMKVLRHDGGEHMLRGIRPTHPAEPTLEGIRAGRDEVLERALELLP